MKNDCSVHRIKIAVDPQTFGSYDECLENRLRYSGHSYDQQSQPSNTHAETILLLVVDYDQDPTEQNVCTPNNPLRRSIIDGGKCYNSNSKQFGTRHTKTCRDHHERLTQYTVESVGRSVSVIPLVYTWIENLPETVLSFDFFESTAIRATYTPDDQYADTFLITG